MKPLLFLFVSLAMICSNINAQQTSAIKPTAPECAQFDFWLGKWDATYNDTVHAENYITKEMGSRLVHEHFQDPANAYVGESWSVYSTKKGVWQQTWVDNQGGYITLTGSYKDGKMTLSTEPILMQDGSHLQSRMVYYNITANSFDWDWDMTTDEGKTWKHSWQIHYKRKQ